MDSIRLIWTEMDGKTSIKDFELVEDAITFALWQVDSHHAIQWRMYDIIWDGWEEKGTQSIAQSPSWKDDGS